MASPPTAAAKGSPGGSRIGRPPQWTVSRSRKLARLYVYTTLTIERILRVLEDDLFRPRKNSAQKTIHKMLDNDPRYLRPESRAEMDQRISALSASPRRLRKRKEALSVTTRIASGSSLTTWLQKDAAISSADVSSTSGSSRKAASFDLSSGRPSTAASPATATRLRRQLVPIHTQAQESETTESDTSSGRVRRIQRKVSDCSTNYARQVSALLRDFTISSASDFADDSPLSASRRPSAAVSERSEHTGPEPFEPFPEPGFAIPGDFLTAHTRSCADFPGQEHGKSCWCVIFQETSRLDNAWILPTGELSDRAREVLNNPSEANISLTDSFGNTALHLFAALEDYQDELLAMVLSGSATLAATNTADQTFLHVLHVEWFTNLTNPSAPLRQLLAFVHDASPALVYQTDVYGRNFFHRLHALVRTPAILSTLVSPFDPSLALRRDAFDFNPDDADRPFVPPRRRPASPPPAAPSADAPTFLAYHTQLIQIIQSSYTNPTVEDAMGRNGLHALAEAILSQAPPTPPPTNPRPSKRARHDLPTASPTPSTSTSVSTANETPLLTRLRHLESLLPPLDPNHYTHKGTTALESFITHLADEHDDRAKTLSSIIETLLRNGARIEARNRRGETSLMVAARLGRKTALTTLLEHGANVHVRDVDGRGILRVVDESCRGARGDLALYARLEAVRALLTGRRDWGVVLAPTVGMEWGVRR
ncbi:hypothetical protein QBC47DRAFT_435104 [Echria macrotheca]|uniref:Ankyrin n=1 Tax=Echria macrotheca TaxID=438768 RepID=A0AAJ0B3V8_9PEZI|nr:hypothetical protein QBC47DRAFT_435104 [Echria macrotheca]